MSKKTRVRAIYQRLFKEFGPQHWWPGETPFEVVVGAILTQNTSWHNVERAIKNLKNNNLLTAQKLYRLKNGKLARLIRPAGYFNVKAKRLKSFLAFLFENYQGSLTKLFRLPKDKLRQKLLGVNGIGPETADSIILYAAAKPIFVVDAYTKRIFTRHRLISAAADYNEVQDFFMKHLPLDVTLFNEYHALLVKLGKDICKKNKPKCDICPIRK